MGGEVPRHQPQVSRVELRVFDLLAHWDYTRVPHGWRLLRWGVQEMWGKIDPSNCIMRPSTALRHSLCASGCGVSDGGKILICAIVHVESKKDAHIPSGLESITLFRERGAVTQSFAVVHYAGVVDYLVPGMLDRNRNSIFETA